MSRGINGSVPWGAGDVLQEAGVLEGLLTILSATVANDDDKYIVTALSALRNLASVAVDIGLRLLARIVFEGSANAATYGARLMQQAARVVGMAFAQGLLQKNQGDGGNVGGWRQHCHGNTPTRQRNNNLGIGRQGIVRNERQRETSTLTARTPPTC